MARFNWTLAVLIACAILGALPIAACDSDGVPTPNDQDTTSSVPAECEGKTDSPGCSIALPGEDAVSSDAEGSPPTPDTEESPSSPPKCSESNLPYPAGTTLDCGEDGLCQLEWHDEPNGCVAYCPPAHFGPRPLSLYFDPSLGQCPPVANL